MNDLGTRGRRRGLVVGAAAGALALVCVLITTGWLLIGHDDDGGILNPAPSTDARWAEGITPEWLSGRMNLDIPATAESPRAAYETTSRVDTGFLTFTLPRSEAEAYLKAHPPEGTWLKRTTALPDTPAHGFSRLGVPEPETLKDGTRYGYICPGSASGASANPYDLTERRCVRLDAQEYAPDRTRIYLSAHFPPGSHSQ
ncbi:hypothetical protein [Streptomyces sp. NPDC058953]|uniref:hypothetical protein n=1 Tax=unclassified Streptomyces TaxID=2593676 RepID=UPI0036D189C7